MGSAVANVPLRILIIKLSSLGDVIQSLPVASALKTCFPSTEISFLVNREYGELLIGQPSIDKIFLFDRRIKNRFFQGFYSNWVLIQTLREKSFDLVIDLQGLFRSGLIAWLSRGRKTIGFDNSREGSRHFYGQRVLVPDPTIHAVDRYLLIPKSLGWVGEPEFLIPIDEKDKVFIEDFMKSEKIDPGLPIVAIHPTARWATKRWPAHHFRRLTVLLHQSKGFQVVFLGSHGELPDIRKIVSGMTVRPILATGKFSLKQLSAFLIRSAILVTNDSGPMHLAVALNVPVLALFGASDFHKTGPYGREEQVVYKNVACSPCLKRTCHNHPFPMECMESITPEEVFEKIQQRVDSY
ncbi:MAG: glycosyltransferase family 9 protein [Nitrospirae bacterium]|nr:glycosyltransferase family 9 protein [Nitrospirota bacterium]MBI3593568.1 glycosyltransferase family 9 protein [Nitrospirota bacterium]